MREVDTLSIDEVDRRLEILHHNFGVLSDTAVYLAEEDVDIMAYQSLATAFDDEQAMVALTLGATPNERVAGLDHALSNLATIRANASDTAVSRLDEAVAGRLRTW